MPHHRRGHTEKHQGWSGSGGSKGEMGTRAFVSWEEWMRKRSWAKRVWDGLLGIILLGSGVWGCSSFLAFSPGVY